MPCIAAPLAGLSCNIANAAVLDLVQHDTSGLVYRQLRRKLRKTEKAGVIVTRSEEVPWQELRDIDQE